MVAINVIDLQFVAFISQQEQKDRRISAATQKAIERRKQAKYPCHLNSHTNHS